MRTKVYCAYLSLGTLGAGVHVQMFRSSGQSDAKPPVFSSQASLLCILNKLKLSGATAHEGQGLLCPSQYTGQLDTEVHDQMSRSGGQSEARSPVFKSSGKLGTHLSTHAVRMKPAAVAEWYRYQTVACLVTSSSPVPLKIHRVGQRCTLNRSRAETSSRGVVVKEGGASSGVVHVT
ncbi:uncharacterized protein TNCV_2971531 [Trichonephila clavipes]|nr:uncharacterized protein TNCV_2971531 [Trichonephila clavipes]